MSSCDSSFLDDSSFDEEFDLNEEEDITCLIMHNMIFFNRNRRIIVLRKFH